MAADIPDGAPLPPPTSVDGMYLAALLDEIRLLRQDLAAVRPELPAGEVELREPARPDARSLPASPGASPAENTPLAELETSRPKKRGK